MMMYFKNLSCFFVLVCSPVIHATRARNFQHVWNDFETQPPAYLTLGFPVIPNPLLYITFGRHATLSDRTSDCRLITLTDCCQEVWGDQWWHYQKQMETDIDHYVNLFIRKYKQAPFVESIVEYRAAFNVPMEAATATAFPQDYKHEPYFTFRCVTTLRPDSLLAFVASVSVRKNGKARWTRTYQVFCHKYQEYAKLLPEISRRDIDLETWASTGRIEIVMGTRETQSGRCVSLTAEQKLLLQDVNSRKRPFGSEEFNIPVSYPYDPTTIDEQPDQITSQLTDPISIELTSGATNCLEVPHTLLPGNVVLQGTVNYIEREPAYEADSIMNDLDRCDINAEDWDVIQAECAQHVHPVFRRLDHFKDPVDLYVASRNPDEYGSGKRKHQLLHSFLQTKKKKKRLSHKLPSDEERAQVRDIDWDSILSDASSQGDPRTRLCATVPASLGPLPLALEQQPKPSDVDTLLDRDTASSSIAWL